MAELGNLKKVAVVDIFERQTLENFAAQGQEAVGGIETIPVAGGGFGEKTEGHVANPADEGHAAEGEKIAEAVALGEIGLPGDEWRDQGGDVFRRHLPIAIELDNDLGAEFESLLVAAEHGSTHTPVVGMGDRVNPRIAAGGLAQDLGGSIRRGIVDDDDVPNVSGDRVQNRAQLALDAVGRDDDDQVVLGEFDSHGESLSHARAEGTGGQLPESGLPQSRASNREAR